MMRRACDGLGGAARNEIKMDVDFHIHGAFGVHPDGVAHVYRIHGHSKRATPISTFGVAWWICIHLEIHSLDAVQKTAYVFRIHGTILEGGRSIWMHGRLVSGGLYLLKSVKPDLSLGQTFIKYRNHGNTAQTSNPTGAVGTFRAILSVIRHLILITSFPPDFIPHSITRHSFVQFYNYARRHQSKTMATVAELRSVFLSEPPGDYHPADIQDRVNDDQYLKRVLDHNEGDAKLALQMLIDILTWRNQVGANDLCESNLNMEYICEGSFFAHGRDVDGRLMLIFICKKHVKGQKDFEDLKRCIISVFDRLEREENGEPITLFLDMDGTGIGNMDMELTKFLINLFKLYYPYFLNYIVIFEMPWVLSAAFKVIKQLLPAKAVSKMKFVTKSTLNQYVSPDQALVSWGGRDDYQFIYEPEDRGDIATTSTDVASKKVTFADLEKGDSKHSSGELLSLRPPDCIIFQRDDEEMSGSFMMTNADGECVSFKIRTTSPEKFRVRPSSGVIPGHGAQTITVTVQPGFTARVLSRDRFLLMAVQVPKSTLTPQELQEVWQKTTNNKIEEYRLKCVFPDSDTKKNGSVLDQMKDPDRQISTLAHAVESLQVDNEFLRSQISHLRSLQYVTVVLTIIVVVFTILIYKSTDESSGFCRGP